MKNSLFISLLFALIFLSACAKSPTIENVLDQTGSSDVETGASCSLNSTGDSSCTDGTGKTESIKSTGETISVKNPGDTSFIKKDVKGFAITSTAFVNKGEIPVQYSCNGKNINPSFEIIGSPKGTQSFAMIVYDPDAPSGYFIHRVIRNLPVSNTKIEEGKMPLGSTIGKNSQGKNLYSGPCPQNGNHKYFFKIYALDTNFGDPQYKATLKQFESTFSGHILGTAEIYGTYSK